MPSEVDGGVGLAAIAAAPVSGLGNRMRCIGSICRIARHLEIPFHLWWEAGPQLPTSLDELFLDAHADLGALPVRDPNDLGDDLQLIRVADTMTVLGPKELSRRALWVEAASLFSLLQPNGRPERADRVRRETGDVLRSLRLAPAVMARVDDTARGVDLEQRIGVHIRRGDAPPARQVHIDEVCAAIDDIGERPELFVATGEFAHARRGDAPLPRRIHVDDVSAAIEDLGERPKLFVATDDVAVLDELDRRYPGRVVAQVDVERDRGDSGAGPHALADAVLLSRTRLILSGGSSFAEFGAMLGDRPRTVLRSWVGA